MNPRVSVSAICTFTLSLPEQLAFWERHGIRRVGVSVAKLEEHGFDAGVELVAGAVRDGVIEAANLIGLGPFVLRDPSGWDARRARVIRAVEAASLLGAPRMVCTTGPAGAMTWEDA